MKGKNFILINQATMQEAVNLWLQSQFKNAPLCISVTPGESDRHDNGFRLAVEEQADEPKK